MVDLLVLILVFIGAPLACWIASLYERLREAKSEIQRLQPFVFCEHQSIMSYSMLVPDGAVVDCVSTIVCRDCGKLLSQHTEETGY